MASTSSTFRLSSAPQALRLVQMLLAVTAVIGVGFWALANDEITTLLAAVILGALLAIYQQNKDLAFYLAIAYLIFLGDIRRIEGWFFGFPAYDLNILVAPLFVTIVMLPVFVRVRLKDTTSKLALALIVVMLLQMFNPAQGGLLVGFSGALISLPPLLWFWAGRTYGSEAVIRTVVYRIMIPAAILASFVGLYQTFVGVPIWQQAWLDHVGSIYSALHLGGNSVRAFGFSTAGSEYLNFISLACFFCLIAAIAGRRVFLLPLIVLLPTLFLGSSRGSIMHLLLAGAIGFTFKSQNKATLPLRFGFALAVGVGGLAFGLSQNGDYVAPKHGASNADYALAHQINGLSHPLDSKYSTAGFHAGEVFTGFLVGFRHPFGYGTGATGAGAAKFSSGGQQVGSEFDLSDTFINLGIPGGLLYLFLIGNMMRAGFRYTRTGPKDISLPIFAMQFALLGDWFFPGEYGNGPLFWLLLGCMIRITSNAEAKEPVKFDRKPVAIRAERKRLGNPVAARAILNASGAQ